MRVLITGGAGFIGSALANRLLLEGHEVRVIDNLSAGSPDDLHEDIHFTRGDVTDKPKLWRILNKVDCVYHLAARVSVPESVLYPTEYNATNVGGTVSLMEAMRDAGVKRVVFASSGAIYGEQGQEQVSEKLPPKPTSPYGVSKLSAEHYVKTIGQLWGIETVILRIFNAYGPGQPLSPSHPPVIPQFIQQALGDGSVIIFGDGNQIRDFVFIDDGVNGLLQAATANKVDKQIINIGSGLGTSINQLAEMVSIVSKHNAQILHIETESGGVSKLVADISTARRLLNYTPKTELMQGLALMFEHDPRFQQLTT